MEGEENATVYILGIIHLYYIALPAVYYWDIQECLALNQ